MAGINDLKNALRGGGRVNKYKLIFSIPSTVATTSDLQDADVLCKATSFPGMTITPIEVFTQGRKFILPGDTAYENTWDVTFYNTADHALRKDIISWMRSADDFQQNTHSGAPGDIMTELGVVQLDSLGNETARYTFHNVWPTAVGAIELADDTDGGIGEFPVTFSLTDWVVGDGELNDPSAGNAETGNSIA